jgi:lipoate-protein ligase A
MDGVKTLRMLINPALPGPVNMARDEALLAACSPAGPITLRFYGWSPTTLSLGYFQDYDEFSRLEPPAGTLPVVRRTTGGGAILHDLEVTYALVIPALHPLVAGRPNHLYALAHRAIIHAVGGGLRMIDCQQVPCGESSRRGPFFCFARRHPLDVLLPDPRGIGGWSKLAGSAQRRTAGAILQHGSIMLDSRFPQQPVATWSALAGRIGFDEAVARLAPAFAAELGLRVEPGEWRREELKSAEVLEERYGGADWTLHRRR